MPETLIQHLESLIDEKVKRNMAKIVPNVADLIPRTEEDFGEITKFGLYPAESCVPFVTKQGTPFYQLDNMAMVPKNSPENNYHYGDWEFRQLEVLYHMPRMVSREAHEWLRKNLFQGSRVNARKKAEYKAKFRKDHRADWGSGMQIEWMKYCLQLKWRDNALFRKDLLATAGKLPVEDATETNYDSNLFWGARLVEVDGKKFYFGCNVLGKLLAQLRINKGKLPYTLPDNFHIFGEPILKL